MKKHPSGRPVRTPKKGIASHTEWPRQDAVVPKLRRSSDQLAGGCGFIWPGEHHLWLETWAKRK